MTHADEGAAPLPERRDLIGTRRRFGVVGPVYEILGFDHRRDDGAWMMQIRVLESGEELAYKLTDVLADPPEA